MTITPEALKAIFPNCPNPEVWAPAISEAWERFGVDTRNARAGFLAIIGNETGQLREVRRENMNYTPARAKQLFPKARNNPMDCADRCAKGPEAFANWIYAGIIGNGDEASGDGHRFRGGGIIQLTGRANYRAAGKALGIDLENHPELLTQDPKVSAAAAAWFMVKYVKILPLLNSASESDFLAAAGKVGWSDPVATQRRLDYRRAALAVVLPAGVERDETGNVRVKDLSQSTIMNDSNKGLSIATLAAGVGSAGPVITSVSGMDWKLAAVLGIVALIAGAGVAYYLLKVKKARRQMSLDGIV